jgi:cytochrome c
MRKFIFPLALISSLLSTGGAFADSCDDKMAKKVFAKCAACHTAEKNGAVLLGPNLYGIIGKASAAAEGFLYSPAMMAYQKTWTEQELNHFLQNPMKVVPGTMMAFAGLRKEEDRKAIICYLRDK